MTIEESDNAQGASIAMETHESYIIQYVSIVFAEIRSHKGQRKEFASFEEKKAWKIEISSTKGTELPEARPPKLSSQQYCIKYIAGMYL